MLIPHTAGCLKMDTETARGTFPDNSPHTQTPHSLAPPQARPHERPLDIGPFTEIQKLIGTDNWNAWHKAISAEFQKQGVWEIVIDDKNVDRTEPPYGLDWPKWKRLDNSLGALLAMTVHRDIMNSVPDGMGGSSFYKHLLLHFKPGPTFSQLLKTLASLHIDDFSSATQYTHKFGDIYRQLRENRPDAISTIMIKALYLEGLGPAWEEFRTEMMEDTPENRMYTPNLVMGMVIDREDEPDSDEEAPADGDVLMNEEIPTEGEIPSTKEMPAVDKQPAQQEKPEGEKPAENEVSSDDATLSGQGVPVQNEATPSARIMPDKEQTPTEQLTSTAKKIPADQEMRSDHDDSSDEDASSDGDDSSSGDDSDMSDDDLPSAERVPATREVNPPAIKNDPAKEGTAAQSSVPAKRKMYKNRQIYDEKDLPSADEDSLSDSDSSGEDTSDDDDDDDGDDDEKYSTGQTPSQGYKSTPTEPARHSNRPFCGHCKVQGHKEQGCWRAQGRTEEEITQMRTELNERRRAAKRRKIERSQEAVTPPPNQ